MCHNKAVPDGPHGDNNKVLSTNFPKKISNRKIRIGNRINRCVIDYLHYE